MPVWLLETIAIAALSAALALSPTARPQTPVAVTDPDAYTIYATLLPTAWQSVSKDALLLQQETEPTVPCLPQARSRRGVGGRPEHVQGGK